MLAFDIHSLRNEDYDQEQPLALRGIHTAMVNGVLRNNPLESSYLINLFGCGVQNVGFAEIANIPRDELIVSIVTNLEVMKKLHGKPASPPMNTHITRLNADGPEVTLISETTGVHPSTIDFTPIGVRGTLWSNFFLPAVALHSLENSGIVPDDFNPSSVQWQTGIPMLSPQLSFASSTFYLPGGGPHFIVSVYDSYGNQGGYARID